MKITNLELVGFRNYEKESLSLSPGVNIIIGNNGEGKTNILEAIYILSLSRSYKAKEEDIINTNADFYKITASVSHKTKENTLTLISSKQGKKILKDNIPIKKISEFVGNLNIVLFSPEDLLLFKNGPAERRELMDMSLLQLSKKYIDDYSQFKKKLKMRNECLKALYSKIKEDPTYKDEMLDVFTEMFIDANKKIYDARKEFLKKLEEKTAPIYKDLSGTDEKIKFEYIVNFKNTKEFFDEKTLPDIYNGTTQHGCHRDDIKFTRDGMDFEGSASQGQQRMLALSIKLALSEMINEVKGETPVILLDDVFSELDSYHQNRLLSVLDKSMQIVITTTDLDKIDKKVIEEALVLKIDNGHAIKEQVWQKN